MVAAGNRVVFKQKRAFRVPSVSSWSQPLVGGYLRESWEKQQEDGGEEEEGEEKESYFVCSLISLSLSLSLCRSRRWIVERKKKKEKREGTLRRNEVEEKKGKQKRKE